MESVVLQYLASLHPTIPLVLAGLGALVVMGQTYVAVSASKKDDAWLLKLEAKPFLGPILKALKSFAPIQKKK